MRPLPFYVVATWYLRIGLKVGTRLHVEGREAVPPRGPLIIVANHLSYLDPPLLSVCIPRRITFLTKQPMFDNPLGYLMMRAWGAAPIDRGGPGDLGSLKFALALLGRDCVLGMFPEGTRSRGPMRPGKPGVALVAAKSQAPILPIGIFGTEKVRGPHGAFSYPHVTVRIGDPFTPPILEGRLTRAHLASLADMIMTRIANLLPPSYRGHYALRPQKELVGEISD